MKMIDNEIRRVTKAIGHHYGEIELAQATGDKFMLRYCQKEIKVLRLRLKAFVSINRNPNGGRARLNGHKVKPSGIGVDRVPANAVDCSQLDLAK